MFTQREGKNTTVLSFSLWAENRDTGREKKNIFLHYLIFLCYTFLLYIVHMWEGKKILQNQFTYAVDQTAANLSSSPKQLT